MTYEPIIIAYLCTWCSYTGADTAGIARLPSPANIRGIRVPCSGRISPEIVMRTFDQGADGVLILGCHIGECHYDSGNHRTAKRIPILKSLMAFVGLEPERIRLDWVSASEGERYSRIVTEFTDTIRALGPVRWRIEDTLTLTPPEIKPLRAVQPLSMSGTNIAARNNLYQMEIRSLAKELLENNLASCVIGYETGPRGKTRPAFIRNADLVDRLVWDQHCTHNLVLYLNDLINNPRQTKDEVTIAIVAKPCDAKSINVLLAENRFSRDQVHIIGIICNGIQQTVGFEYAIQDNSLPLQTRCLACEERTPAIYDTLIGEVHPQSQIENDVPPMKSEIEILDALSPADRMDFWLNEFDRCIRCYACRQACPVCYCPTCLYERDDSLWVSMGIMINEKRTFHLGRAYHVAGRCVGCNECERVCPMGIPISLLNQKISREMELQFGHRAGVDIKPSPFVTILSDEERTA